MAESHLSSGRINVSLLRDIYRRELLDYLDRCQGTKVLRQRTPTIRLLMLIFNVSNAPLNRLKCTLTIEFATPLLLGPLVDTVTRSVLHRQHRNRSTVLQ